MTSCKSQWHTNLQNHVLYVNRFHIRIEAPAPGYKEAFFNKKSLIKNFNYLVVPICLVISASSKRHKYYWSFPPLQALKSLCICYTGSFVLSADRFKTSDVPYGNYIIFFILCFYWSTIFNSEKIHTTDWTNCNTIFHNINRIPSLAYESLWPSHFRERRK